MPISVPISSLTGDPLHGPSVRCVSYSQPSISQRYSIQISVDEIRLMEVYPIEDCPAEVYIVAGAKFEHEKIALRDSQRSKLT